MPHSLNVLSRTVVCRLSVATTASLWVLTAGAALAAGKTAPLPPPPPAASQPASSGSDAAAGTVPSPGSSVPMSGQTDPIVANVEGHPIYLSDLGRAEQALPANLRTMPFEALYPVLVDRMVDHQALVMLARRRDLEDDPTVKKQIQDATDRVLEGALLARVAAPKVTEAAIKARYDQLYAHRPATEQVRASHILVSTKEEAEKLIADLRNGADFATLAQKYSKDPDGKKGGDLGFFNREQVWPGFADMAFSLQPGQVGAEPIHNEFGWHVVMVQERRLVAPPTYSDVHEMLREQLLQEAVRQEVALARSELDIKEWNLDGSAITPAAQSGSVAAKPN